MTPTPPRKPNEPKCLTLGEIASLVGGKLVGGEDGTSVTGVCGIKDARSGDITFIANDKYLPFLAETSAVAVIAGLQVVCPQKALILVENPSQAFTKVVLFFAPQGPDYLPGVHPSAVLGNEVDLGENISIGANAVIGSRCRIGSGSVVGANCFIGADSVIGVETVINPMVTVRERTHIGNHVIIHSGTVIGSDGYGYETIDDEHIKIPHTGSVLIEDDVEIGANVCIDRGRFKETIIGTGSKIDNLVQIAHNVIIGPNCLIVSQVGISGSTTLGKNVIIAGQAGVVGHISIGDHAIIGAGAGVSKPVMPNAIVLGSPAKPIQEQKRLFALISRLPQLFKEFSEMKKKINEK